MTLFLTQQEKYKLASILESIEKEGYDYFGMLDSLMHSDVPLKLKMFGAFTIGGKAFIENHEKGRTWDE